MQIKPYARQVVNEILLTPEFLPEKSINTLIFLSNNTLLKP